MYAQDLYVFIIPYTERTATGEWLAHDDFRHDGGWTEPKRYQRVIVAPTKELAIAQMLYGFQIHGKGPDPKIIEAEIVKHRVDCLIAVNFW